MKSKKPVVKKTCPKCGREMSKRGLNGHVLNCKGASKPDLSPGADHLPKEAPQSNASFDMDAELIKEAGFQQNPETNELKPVPSKEQIEAQYHVGAKEWAGIFWLIGDSEDKVVDWVGQRYPSDKDKLMKCNLSHARALEMGELAYQIVGPTKPEYVLAAFLISTYLPPVVCMITVMLPKEVLMKMLGSMTKYTTGMFSKLRPPEKPKEEAKP